MKAIVRTTHWHQVWLPWGCRLAVAPGRYGLIRKDHKLYLVLDKGYCKVIK